MYAFDSVLVNAGRLRNSVTVTAEGAAGSVSVELEDDVEEADAAAENWAKQFQQRGIAEDIPTVSVSLTTEGLSDAATNEVRVPKLLVLSGLAASAGEASRKLTENAVSLNGEKLTTRTITREALGESPVLRLGKRQVRLAFAPAGQTA